MNQFMNTSGIVLVNAAVLGLLVGLVNGDVCDAATRVQ